MKLSVVENDVQSIISMLPRDCLLLTATALELRQKKPMEEEGIQEEVKQAELLDAACSIQIRTPTV